MVKPPEKNGAGRPAEYDRAVVEDVRLDALKVNGIRWIVDHQPQFDAAHPAGLGRLSGKALAELAVVVRRLRDAPGGVEGLQPITEWLRALPARDYALRRRADVVGSAFLLSIADPETPAARSLREALQRNVDAGLLDALERPPHRVMEECLALEWAGIDHPLPPWQALVAASLAAAAPNPLSMGEAAAYQLTHVVMYATAFGSRPPACGPEQLGGQRQRLATLMLRFVIRGHWDLVAELLLSWACLGLGPSEVCDAAWQALLEQVAPDGSIPAVAPEAAGESEPGPWFAARYHTTLVVVMAAETWLRPAVEPSDGRVVIARPPRRRATAALSREVVAIEIDDLASLLADGAEHDLRARCSALVGVWAGTALCPEGERVLAALAQSVAAADALGAWAGVPAPLALVTYGVLAQRDLVPDGLARLVAMAAGALARSTPADRTLDEARWLVGALGRAGAPTPPSAAGLAEQARHAAAQRTPAAIAALVAVAESRSGYGTVQHSQPSWIGELLLAFAAHRARAGDLVLAGRATRAALHLGDGSAGAGARDVAEQLACRQRPGGGFTATLPGGGRDYSPADRAAVSLSCLWTIAEAATGWRLMTAIGPPRRYQ